MSDGPSALDTASPSSGILQLTTLPRRMPGNAFARRHCSMRTCRHTWIFKRRPSASCSRTASSWTPSPVRPSSWRISRDARRWWRQVATCATCAGCSGHPSTTTRRAISTRSRWRSGCPTGPRGSWWRSRTSTRSCRRVRRSIRTPHVKPPPSTRASAIFRCCPKHCRRVPRRCWKRLTSSPSSSSSASAPTATCSRARSTGQSSGTPPSSPTTPWAGGSRAALPLRRRSRHRRTSRRSCGSRTPRRRRSGTSAIDMERSTSRRSRPGRSC